MSQSPDILRGKLTELLRWEKRKRCEELFAALSFYSFLAAALALPFYAGVLAGANRWLAPASFALVLAPLLFFKRRWRQIDSVRALARADRSLGLEERVITAWELLRRDRHSAAALLVFKEAGEKLKTVDARALFPRRWSWHAYLVLPALAVWLGLGEFAPGIERGGRSRPPAPTLAQEVQRFSRELQAKARSEGLSESLRLGRELEQVAQRGAGSNASHERLKAEVGGVIKKMDLAAKAVAKAPSLAGGGSEEKLTDLKAELEAAREMVGFSNGAPGILDAAQPWLDRLTEMPQLKRYLDQDGGIDRALGRNEAKALLDRLHRQVTDALDRRALLDAQQVLERMIKPGEGKSGEGGARTAGRGEPKTSDDGLREKNNGLLAGTEPGKGSEGAGPLPQPQGGAMTHLKGSLGAGQSSSLLLRSRPSAGKIEISQEEVIASYRRQAEAELNGERVPEALRETVKRYFLSLGSEEAKP